MERHTAIDLIANAEASLLSPEERADRLDHALLEDLGGLAGWEALPEELRSELKDGELREPPESARYDRVLPLLLRGRYAAATNAYILARLRALGIEADTVHGAEPDLVPCPCCGRCTLSERGCYEICPVCWWEDDGLDNESAHEQSGPNHMSLLDGRAYYLMQGIYDPARSDLRKHQEPAEKFAVGRVFELADSGWTVLEPAAGWRASRRS